MTKHLRLELEIVNYKQGNLSIQAWDQFSLEIIRGALLNRNSVSSLDTCVRDFQGRNNVCLTKEPSLTMLPFQNLWQLLMLSRVVVKAVIYSRFHVFLANNLDMFVVAIRSFAIIAKNNWDMSFMTVPHDPNSGWCRHFMLLRAQRLLLSKWCIW